MDEKILHSKFNCELCHFKCNKKSDFERHLLTRKHKIQQKNAKNSENNINKEIYECECGKFYNHRASLFNHKKKCKNEIQELKDELEQLKSLENKDDLIIKLLKDNLEMKELLKEQQKQMLELIPKIGNTNITNNTTNNTTNNNNTFNLQLFLNETCKNAINMSDFIETIQFTDADLENSRIHGGVSTLSNKMIKGLQELDVTKRPVHCTDVKRETLYIKEQEKWEKDENHEKIMEAFGNIAQKQRDYLWEWSDANPDTQDVMHPLNDVFHHTNVKVLDPINFEEKEGRKFIRNIAKEIKIDRENTIIDK